MLKTSYNPESSQDEVFVVRVCSKDHNLGGTLLLQTLRHYSIKCIFLLDI